MYYHEVNKYMSKLEKRLRELSNGVELPWYQITTLLEGLGMKVQAPTGGGSHYKIFVKGKPPLTIPVHNGKIKKVYAKKIAEFLAEFIDVDQEVVLLIIGKEEESMKKKLEYYMNLKYPTQLTEIAVEDGGGYLVEIPLLKGCISDGETIAEALENIKEAKIEWFIYMLENELPIPEPADENKYSGKFVVRIPKSLHKTISEQSKLEGLSLNQYVANSLAYVAGQKKVLFSK